MRNMRVGIAIYGMKVNISYEFVEVVLIDFLTSFSFKYVHFILEYALIH
jgi:hypothetical protein